MKRCIPSLCDQVVYKPCRITVLNNGKGVEATLLPILTSELEYLLNMNIDRYYSASYEKSTKTIFWTNRTSGDALMLSPEQYKKIDSQPWDVKGLGRKTLAVGSEYWIPNLLSYDGDENIKLMKWRNVWLVEDVETQRDILLRVESLKRSNAFPVTLDVWKNVLENKWPVAKLFDIPETMQCMVQSEFNDFNQEWVEQISTEKHPWVWYVPDNNTMDPFLLWKLYKAASASGSQIFPQYQKSFGLFKLYVKNYSDLQSFYTALEEIVVPDLHVVSSADKKHHYRLWLSKNESMYLSTDPNQRHRSTQKKSWDSLEFILNHLKEFYEQNGF